MKPITSERSSRGLEQDRSASRKVPLLELGPLADSAVCMSAVDLGRGDLEIYGKIAVRRETPLLAPKRLNWPEIQQVSAKPTAIMFRSP
jgi:hypothetical protein